MKSSLKCPGTSLEKFLDCAFRAIIEAKLGLVDKDEALDALWEYLVNIDYEVKVLEKRLYINDAMNKESRNAEDQ